MDERVKFCFEHSLGQESMTDLCRKYGISRQSGYKWLGRYEAEGFGGLNDRSRAPHNRPNTMPRDIEELIVAERRRRPTWGPKKLLAVLARSYPKLQLPARSTVAVLLQRRGLVAARRKPQRTPTYEGPFTTCRAPNELWCADFKGNFRMSNGRVCNPFTLTDAHSRYLLRCDGLTRIDEFAVRPLLEAAFREHGLPLAIRTDNGPPFASRTVAGLSRLSIWWIKLGIRPERIEPGKPTQNGRHERMHRTLKQETAAPPKRNMEEQQLAFDCFRKSYNDERPHEALGQDVPAQHYRPALRLYPSKLREPEYGDGLELRKVHKGYLKWRGKQIYLSETLERETVGIEELGDGKWLVYFGPLSLGILNAEGQFQRPGRGRTPWGAGPK